MFSGLFFRTVKKELKFNMMYLGGGRLFFLEVSFVYIIVYVKGKR